MHTAEQARLRCQGLHDGGIGEELGSRAGKMHRKLIRIKLATSNGMTMSYMMGRFRIIL